MPYLSNPDFRKVRAHLDALAALTELHTDEEDAATEAMALMDAAIESVAGQGLRDLAHEQYGTDEVEIDDEGVGTSDGSEGTFVQAWVWVSHEDQIAAGIMDDPDAEDDDEDEVNYPRADWEAMRAAGETELDYDDWKADLKYQEVTDLDKAEQKARSQ